MKIFKFTGGSLMVVAMTAFFGNLASAATNDGDQGVIEFCESEIDSVSFVDLITSSDCDTMIHCVPINECDSSVECDFENDCDIFIDSVLETNCDGFIDGGRDCDSFTEDLACRGCGSCGGCKCGGKTLYLGVEATFLAPLYDNGSAEFTLIDWTVPAGATIGSTYDKADQLTGAPRITVGWGGKHGIGIQARYWDFNDSASFTDFPPPVIIGVDEFLPLGGADTFDAYTVDLELTKQFCRHGWELLGTFGVRYAEYDHARTNSVYGVVNDDVFSLGSLQSESFHGTGLTFSLAGLRPLKRKPCLALYASVRGSTLFGEADALAVTSSSVSAAGGGYAGSVNGALAFDDETMFITELQTGLQWSRCTRSFNGRMFARAGFEYQFWSTDDQTAAALSRSFTANSEAIADVSGREQDFDLIGFSIASGFAW